jgi:hypothetical protein
VTPANRSKLKRASQGFKSLSEYEGSTQQLVLSIYNILELVFGVLTDLAFRPEVNEGNKQ